ncbi:hypothetical protein [Rhabdothermincola sp.]|uniref:hypothetical protein n=1 Tax=Rhabdothermincola sp. TaxID=2820405 RepID=UPI002FE22C80
MKKLWWCLLASFVMITLSGGVFMVGKHDKSGDAPTSPVAEDASDVLDHPFQARVKLEARLIDGGRYGQEYRIEYRGRDDWVMVTGNAFSDHQVGTQPDPDGTTTIARDGVVQIFSEPVYSASDPSSGQSPRLLDEMKIDPGQGSTPLGLFSLRYIQSVASAGPGDEPGTIEYTVSKDGGVQEVYTYSATSDRPIMAKYVDADGSTRVLTVVEFVPL